MLDSFGIYLYIFSLSLVHITGFFIFLSYYLSHKHFRYYLFSLGWLLSLIGTIIFLIPYYLEDFTLFSIAGLFNTILIAVGTYFISVGLLSHFISIDKVKMNIISILIIIVPVSAYIIRDYISFEFALLEGTVLSLTFSSRLLYSDITSLEQILIFLFLIVIGLKYREKILQYSTVSYVLYLTGVSLSLLTTVMIQFPAFQTDELPVLFNFTMTIWVVIVLMLFLIHLEHNMSMKEKYILKDHYSHDMAQFIQLAMGNLDLLRETDNEELFTKLQNNLNDTSELLRQIRDI
jgi:hypothetical protein